jgi:hypothetical protein
MNICFWILDPCISSIKNICIVTKLHTIFQVKTESILYTYFTERRLVSFSNYVHFSETYLRNSMVWLADGVDITDLHRAWTAVCTHIPAPNKKLFCSGFTRQSANDSWLYRHPSVYITRVSQSTRVVHLYCIHAKYCDGFYIHNTNFELIHIISNAI